jgi:hypothetical protein
MFQASDLRARIRRLDELTRGLMKEVVHVEDAQDPLLYLERRAYLAALREAVGGLETARVTLARALQRLQEEASS